MSMTVCMICAIMSKPDELNLKAPVALLAMRSIFHLAERYRLATLLRLQWVNLVRLLHPLSLLDHVGCAFRPHLGTLFGSGVSACRCGAGAR